MLLWESTLATEWHTTSNNYSKSPHPTFGHLLPMSGEKGKKREIIWKQNQILNYGLDSAGQSSSIVIDYYYLRCIAVKAYL